MTEKEALEAQVKALARILRPPKKEEESVDKPVKRSR